MVIFGVKCVVMKKGGYDLYGNKKDGDSFNEKCAVVKLEAVQRGTTVRVDMGATRGGADEYRADAVLLLNKKTHANLDDIIYVSDQAMNLRVMSKRARYNVAGKLDHYEIEAVIEQAN